MTEQNPHKDEKDVKDKPKDQGEIPRKRDDSKDDRKGPYREGK